MTDEYHGRLAFDPETNFHIAEDGRPVLTEDDGKTWRYADEGDASHFERHHRSFAAVDGTANELMNLQLEHGREKAEEIMREQSPHHFDVTPDDEHFQEGATHEGVVTHTRLQSSPDAAAVIETGHTEAWL